MMGVEMFLAALMISLMRGTPSVTFMDATPAKWNVFSVIWVPGSPAWAGWVVRVRIVWGVGGVPGSAAAFKAGHGEWCRWPPCPLSWHALLHPHVHQ